MKLECDSCSKIENLPINEQNWFIEPILKKNCITFFSINEIGFEYKKYLLFAINSNMQSNYPFLEKEVQQQQCQIEILK